MESQPQNPEFRINPKNFHLYISPLMLIKKILIIFFPMKSAQYQQIYYR